MQPLKFRPIPLNRLRPRGWLKRQLQIQAEGLSGNLDKVWPDIAQSKWIGGDREGWERVPYWLDGFIPLAWLLEDEDLKARARRYIDAILARQEEDGWLCPCTREERRAYDMWALILIAKVFTVYADLSGDERIEPALRRALRQFNTHIDSATLFNWSAARWFEGLIPIFWLYEKSPEPWLMELAQKLEVEGIDYEKLFEHYMDQQPRDQWTYLTHVVNLAMCLKSAALVSRMRGGDPDAFALRALAALQKYHGMAVGHFTGDECVSGDSPIQGSELCSVVEAMYSCEQLLQIGGNPFWADHLEKLAFNALPATISPDMWSHQYDQQTNQVQCAPLEKEHCVFRTNGVESHVFGLEPNFGCCTANFNQGWPKFALSTFMLSEDGIASTVLAPSEAEVRINGAMVKVALDTEYPFRNTLRYTVETSMPVRFAFSVRVPAAADSAKLDGQAVTPGTFARIEREWLGRNEIVLELTFAPRLVERPRDMRCLWYGPLLYAVPVKARWEKREYTANGVERKYPYCDYSIRPQSPFNYAFAGTEFVPEESPVGDCPFSEEGAPMRLAATMVQIPWSMQHGVCAVAPESCEPMAAPEKLRLIPYGCTTLRITEMPMAKIEA